MKNNIYYETVSEAISDLAKRGYTIDFKVHTDDECLICHKSMTQLSPDDFDIDETHRFEGNTDPGDEMIVYAISSLKHHIKGIVVNAYGMYADSVTSKLVKKLHENLNPK
ncbi:MAG: phosphoribosylpyrophosphate synthetase [Bacteroidia bacterium]|nr:phosphoribosylpyrophosphate synthetase [Bacteroidia bacterium]